MRNSTDIAGDVAAAFESQMEVHYEDDPEFVEQVSQQGSVVFLVLRDNRRFRITVSEHTGPVLKLGPTVRLIPLQRRVERD